MFSFDWRFMKVADSPGRHKISDEFAEYSLWSYLPLSAKTKTHIRLCPEHSLCHFYPIIMKLADK